VNAERPRIPLPDDPTVPKFGTPIDFAVAEFAASVRREQTIDARTAELVRLRCASYHDCRRCKSLRTPDTGLDEETISKLDHDLDAESGFSRREFAALQLVDAMLVHPATLTPEFVSSTQAELSPGEISWILLAIVKFSQQKASVALRIEPAADEGLRALDIGSDGLARVGGAVARDQRAHSE
jgi:hypothetical protein